MLGYILLLKGRTNASKYCSSIPKK